MALIPCKRCGCPVSTRAERCPHCGLPVTESMDEETRTQHSVTPEAAPPAVPSPSPVTQKTLPPIPGTPTGAPAAEAAPAAALAEPGTPPQVAKDTGTDAPAADAAPAAAAAGPETSPQVAGNAATDATAAATTSAAAPAGPETPPPPPPVPATPAPGARTGGHAAATATNVPQSTPRTEPTQPAAAGPGPETGRPEGKRKRRNPWWIVLLLALAVIAVGGAAAYYLLYGPSRTPTYDIYKFDDSHLTSDAPAADDYAANDATVPHADDATTADDEAASPYTDDATTTGDAWTSEHYSGSMTDENGTYPIEIALERKGDAIRNCIYTNVELGGKIRMEGTVINGMLILTGKDGNYVFQINVDLDSLEGVATDGPKTLSVSLEDTTPAAAY